MQSPEAEAKFVAEVDAVVGDRRPSECGGGAALPSRSRL